METKDPIVGMTMSNTHSSASANVTKSELRHSNIFSSFQEGYKTVTSSQHKCEIKILMFISRIVQKTIHQHNYSLFHVQRVLSSTDKAGF